MVRLTQYVAGRVKRCRELLRQQGLDGLIVAAPEDVRYLTGFGGDDSVLVLTEKGRVLVTDSRYTVQVRQECRGLAMVMRKGAMSEAVGEVCGRLLPKRGRRTVRIGLERDSVTVGQYKGYRKTVSRGLQVVGPLVAELRLCKDEYEVGQIRKAAVVAAESILEVVGWLEPGMSEREVAARLDYEMGRRGSEKPAFASIVAFGDHAAQPHAVPGARRLKIRDTILFDWGATLNGYRSDLTRCYAVGRILPVFAEAYRRVLESQMAAISVVKAGVRLKDVDAAARQVLRGRGLPMYGHGTGHGLGLQVHEGPYVNGKQEMEMREGMVVTIEPGVYVSGSYGIRIEDDVLVGARGPKVLSRLAKDFASILLK